MPINRRLTEFSGFVIRPTQTSFNPFETEDLPEKKEPTPKPILKAINVLDAPAAPEAIDAPLLLFPRPIVSTKEVLPEQTNHRLPIERKAEA